MPKGVRFAALLVLALGGGWTVAKGVSWLKQADVFAVQDVLVEGNEFVGRDEVIRTAGFAESANVWDEAEEWITALTAHPLIRVARVRRRLPSTLVLEIEETQPVALVPTPTLQPVDASGRLLPLDPADHRLDLPILRIGSGDLEVEEGVPTRLARRLAAEALQLSQLDPELGARISELWLEEDGSFGMVLVEPRVEIRFRAPLTIPVLDRGLWTLQDALDQAEEAVPMHLDLRFADRVFLRFDRATLRPVP